MRKYLKESLHWVHLALFKPMTFEAETRQLTRGQAALVFLRVLPVQLAISLMVVSLVGILSEWAGIRFNWGEGLLWVSLGPVGGVLFGLVGGLRSALFIGLFIGLIFGLLFGLGNALSSGLGAGLVIGLIIALISGLGVRLVEGLGVGLVVGLGVLFVALIFEDVRTEALYFGLAHAVVFAIVYLRLLHLVPYAFQRWRSRKAADPFLFFRNSPVYWDEAIAVPLPFLSAWLVELTRFDRERGMGEIAKVARLPNQRRAAQRALVTILVIDFQQADRVEKMVSAPQLLAILPSDKQDLPKGLDDVARHVVRVADLASDYLTRVTPVGQMNALRELRVEVESLYESLYFVMVLAPVGPALGIRSLRWLEIVKAEEVRVSERIAFEPIPNPFVVGNPLMVRDQNLFKGRKDIIVAIEENIINPAQRPALLLYGRRRIGKTSTLLNLPRLLSNKFVPVFIDCQDAKWREGDEAFCYHLAASIHDALNQRALVEAARKPQFEHFERYAFTRLGEYLDQIEESSRSAQKQILLTFDEYEKLEQGISAAKLTTEVLNQLRTIVQHRERIVVLFSGNHRFEEMRTINWSDYLINVKMLELSFLAPEDARELITEPVPALQYESGVIEQVIGMTHCQPYLLQAVASGLVNYLNSEKRMLATAADLQVAVEKVLVTAQAYFFYTWAEECSDAERAVLRTVATGKTNNHTLAEREPSLQSLCHKEILERQPSGYHFSIELFRRWVLKNQTTPSLTHGNTPEPTELEYSDLQTTHT